MPLSRAAVAGCVRDRPGALSRLGGGADAARFLADAWAAKVGAAVSQSLAQEDVCLT